MTATGSTLPSAHLYCREGTSDKEYRAAIEEVQSGFIVTYAYGKRGATLRPGVHRDTPNPVTLDAARTVYDRLLNEKLSKGYKPIDAPAKPGTGYTSPAGHTRTDDSMAVMLLTPVEDASPFLRDNRYISQPKYDGIRLLLKIRGADVTAQNRKGLTREFPAGLADEMRRLAFDRCWSVDSDGSIVLDGECVGDRFHAFDVLQIDGRDIRGYRAVDRLELLAKLFEDFESDTLVLAQSAHTADEKIAMYGQLRREGWEGIVFKHFAARYIGGRTDKGIKVKFWESVTALVIADNLSGAILDGKGAKVPANTPSGRRSIQIAMVQFGATPVPQLVNVGDVTVVPGREMPVPGTFVEIKYLYADAASRKVIQPHILAVRDDVELTDCNLNTQKIKRS